MKIDFTKFNKFLAMMLLLVSLCSCIVVDIASSGVFKKPIIHDSEHTAVHIDIPNGIFDKEGAKFFGEKDGSKIVFHFLGRCGNGISFSGIIIPIFPWLFFNKCEEDGFYISTKYYLGTIGVQLQLRYNGITYDPYIDNGSIKFKISNFSAFKNAKDKTLIIHKKKPDGTMWSKELPFDWKIVVSVVGGL